MKYGELIITAWAFDYKGSGTELGTEETSQALESKDLAWVHLNALHDNARQWLREEANYLDPTILDALLAEESRPRILELDEGVLLNLRGINHNDGEDLEDMVSVRVWVDSSRIISLERRPSKATQDIEQSLILHQGPKNSGEFIAQLAKLLLQSMDPIISGMEDYMDDLEEQMTESPNQAAKLSIINIRKQAIMFRRYLSPQRDVMSVLKSIDFPWIKTSHHRQLQESHDSVQRYVEEFDLLRDRAQIIKDEIANTMATKLNENLFFISILAAIFLPLSFITGLFGINIPGLPGMENPNAFWLFNATLGAIVFVEVLIFKILKWF